MVVLRRIMDTSGRIRYNENFLRDFSLARRYKDLLCQHGNSCFLPARAKRTNTSDSEQERMSCWQMRERRTGTIAVSSISSLPPAPRVAAQETEIDRVATNGGLKEMANEAIPIRRHDNTTGRLLPFESETDKGRTITVLVADDHPVVREGLMSLIGPRPEIRVVAAASN